ncbi:MAG: GerMN domain-containing protein [Patescibacteria group bacterium]
MEKNITNLLIAIGILGIIASLFTRPGTLGEQTSFSTPTTSPSSSSDILPDKPLPSEIASNAEFKGYLATQKRADRDMPDLVFTLQTEGKINLVESPNFFDASGKPIFMGEGCSGGIKASDPLYSPDGRYALQSSPAACDPDTFIALWDLKNHHFYQLAYCGAALCGTDYFAWLDNNRFFTWGDYDAGPIIDGRVISATIYDLSTQTYETYVSNTWVQYFPRMSIKLFFFNTVKDSQILDCRVTYPVERQIHITKTPATESVALWMQGPTEEEKKLGYTGGGYGLLSLNSVTITNGVATVKFSLPDYDINGPGSAHMGLCGDLAFQSGIANTLKQFPSVESVNIYVNNELWVPEP